MGGPPAVGSVWVGWGHERIVVLSINYPYLTAMNDLFQSQWHVSHFDPKNDMRRVQ